MSHHVVSLKTYTLVFVALLVLLAFTVWAAEIEHDVVNLIIALSIALTKTTLIVLFFMHVRYSPFIVHIAAATGVIWLLIMMTFTLSDYITR